MPNLIGLGGLPDFHSLRMAATDPSTTDDDNAGRASEALGCTMSPIAPEGNEGLSTLKTASGGDQYIHNERESEERQEVLHQCFRRTSHDAFRRSGIVAGAAAAASAGSDFHLLEIGCGAGFGTLDAARWLPGARVTGIDANAAMTVAAFRRRRLAGDRTVAGRVRFRTLSGEAAADALPHAFDAVWIRYVVVHVPDPEALLRAAVACLRPGGTLLVEDMNLGGYVAEPPLRAHALIHRAHAAASLTLGGDIGRGPRIGGYLRDAGLGQVRSHAFVPLFGRGVEVQPWCDVDSGDFDPIQHFEQGLKLLRMSLESAAPIFLKLGTCTEDELVAARESLPDAETAEYQLFSLPGGQMFQWWGVKPPGVTLE